MTIAGYGRVSTAKDAQLESLEHQVDFFSQYASAHRYGLYRVYADEGISGKQAKNRREFQKMLEDARLHRFDMVVVKDISRFARNTVDLLTATRELRDSGIEVQFLSNNQTILGNSEFVLTVFGALAQEESASLSKRVKFGKKLNAQKGRVPNRIYGYRQLDTFHLEIVEEEAAVIRSAFERYVKEGLGTRRICTELNGEGVRTREGVLWRPTTLRRMLKNPIYRGILETHKYDTVDFLTGRKRMLEESERFRLERPELAIVSGEIWERAQEILRERGGQHRGEDGRRGRYSSAHLFSTLIRCGDCGYSFSRKHWSSEKSGTVYYWACSGRSNFTSDFCPNGTSLRERDLAAALGQYFLSRLPDPRGFARQAADRALEEKPGAGKSAEEAEKKLESLRRREARLKELYTNDLLSMDELKSSLETLQNGRAALKARMAERAASPSGGGAPLPGLPQGDFGPEQLLEVSEWTNADLRRVIDKITVSASGEVTVHIMPLGGRPP